MKKQLYPKRVKFDEEKFRNIVEQFTHSDLLKALEVLEHEIRVSETCIAEGVEEDE